MQSDEDKCFRAVICPGCGVSPLVLKPAQSSERMDAFQGRECASCGHVLSDGEVESAMKKGFETFMIDGAKR